MKKFLLLLIIPFLIFGQIVECDDDFAPLTLSWFGADSTTTFNIVGLSSGELYSQSIFNISGEITDCFPINLEDDCFTISISGPETLSWNLYTYFSNEPFISGTNEDFIFGPQCVNSGCTDITACNYDANAEIESGDCIYPALTFSNNDTIPDEPPVNFNYSAWDGCPFGGVDIWF